MRFDFDDTQYALRDLARDLFAKESPPARVRGMWEGKPFDRGVWRTMAEAGLVGITVPEEFGGAGGNEIDLVLVFEEAGRSCIPEPLLETTGFAAPLIAEGGSPQMKERWLPAIASGDALVAVAGPYDAHVAWANEADLLILMHGDDLHAVPKGRFVARPIDAIDPSRPLATIENVDVGPDTRIAAYDETAVPAGTRAVLGIAATLNGISMKLLEMTVAYVKDRHQFGRPVGSFQAVKHKLAAMHVGIASARPAAWYAGYAIATQGPDALTASSAAKIVAARVEEMCNREALQFHGGIGFTWEHDLHLWLKRGMTLRATYGALHLHRRALVPALLGR